MAAKDEAVRTVLIAAVAALLGIGVIMIYSTTARGDGTLLSRVFVRQIIYIVLGVSLAFIFGRSDYRVILRHHRVILAAAAVLLLLVLIPGVGRQVNGARRWLRVGWIGFQPSEMAKLAVVIFLSAFLAERADRLRSFKETFLPAMAVTATVCALIVMEPDIGTTLLVAVVAWTLLFVAGSKLVYLVGPPLVALPVLFVIVRNCEYAWRRIVIWFDPWSDPQGAGYHIIQSLIAVGSGGLTGVGLGASKQKLLFLPEASSDFILAVLAEELGLIGATMVLILYAAFIICGLLIARRAADLAGSLLAIGITCIIALQALINIGVVTQILPTKGIPLPFISAGGSAAVFMLMGVGILYSISRHSSPVTHDLQVE